MTGNDYSEKWSADIGYQIDTCLALSNQGDATTTIDQWRSGCQFGCVPYQFGHDGGDGHTRQYSAT
jgi:hypothetical protein